MDIDIDFKNRNEAVELLKPIAASRIEGNNLQKHNVGVYFQNIPQFDGQSLVDYRKAEDFGFTKIDFLNLHVYEPIKDNAHLDKLVQQEPLWELFTEREIVSQLFQLHTEINTEICVNMKPASVEELAMVLAIGRPGKQHLIGKSFSELVDEIWKPTEAYYYKKSHAVGYAMVIIVQLNLIVEQLTQA